MGVPISRGVIQILQFHNVDFQAVCDFDDFASKKELFLISYCEYKQQNVFLFLKCM